MTTPAAQNKLSPIKTPPGRSTDRATHLSYGEALDRAKLRNGHLEVNRRSSAAVTREANKAAAQKALQAERLAALRGGR